MGLVKRMASGVDAGETLPTAYAESRKSPQPPTFTPATSEAGDMQASSSTRSAETVVRHEVGNGEASSSAYSTQPVEQAEPARPAVSAQPAESVVSAKSVRSAQPEMPAASAQSAQTAQPAEPVEQARPGQWGIPSDVDGMRAASSTSQPDTELLYEASVAPEPTPAGLPPTYAESVDLGSDRHVEAGPPATRDHKIQDHDELHGDDSSDLDGDDSDLTLDDLVDEDEAAWALDDYAASHAPPSYEDATTVVSEDDLIREIIAAQHAHAGQPVRSKLPCPVIIPQRRQRTNVKSRGFVRAYAPVLQNVGIDQDTFLRFLTNFHKSTQTSPWFTIIEVSSTATHNTRPAIGFAVEAAVKAAVTARRNAGSEHDENNFLDRMNAELFRPAGVFAFLMKYKPDKSMPDGGEDFFGVAAENINLLTNQIVAKYGSDGVSGLANQMSMFRIASGVSDGADDLPEAAPLVFPEIDEQAARNGGQALNDKNEFVQDYLNRRAGIKFARQDSKDSKNSLSDEKAPSEQSMFSGGVVGLLTGGYLNLQSLRTQRQEARQDCREARRDRRQEKREDRREARHERILDRHQRRVGRAKGLVSSLVSTPSNEPEAAPAVEAEPSRQRAAGRRRRHRRGKDNAARGTMAKVMTEDVVYLMIVNLPSDAELAATVEVA